MKKFILPALILLVFNSCIGLSMDIQMNRDGSGRLVMEYRISSILENLGTFDGNRSTPAIPLSAEDWAKTIERNPGIKLVSLSSRETAQDTVINVTLDFNNEEALKKLLDPASSMVSINRNGNSGTMDIIILNDQIYNGSLYDDSMVNLMKMIFSGYNFSVSFSGPGNTTLTILDSKGNSKQAPVSSAAVLTGRRVSFSIAIMEILNITDGLGLRFNW